MKPQGVLDFFVYAMDCVYHAIVFLAIVCYLSATAVWFVGNAAWLLEVVK